MKILHVSGSCDCGGAERVLLRLAQGFRKVRPDWEIDAMILCRYGHGTLFQDYANTYHRTFPGSPLYENAHWEIMRLCGENGYDIVHCIDSFHLTRMAAQWLWPHVKFIQNVFPNVAKSPFAPLKEWMDNPNLPYAALVTEFRANAARLPKLPHGEVMAIPNGIDTAFWTPGDTERGIDVVWCARTDAEKGIDTAMELVPLLCETGMDYRIVTSEYDGPTDRLAALGTQYENFTHTSGLPPGALRSLFRRSRIFLSTSQVEGMPATPIEAAACGCWPLVPDIDGLSEVFGERPEFTYDPAVYDTPQLAARLQGIIRNGCNLGKVSHSIASRYSLDAMVNSYIDLYERLAHD
jgi:glycosyltransferase involved in cell wall biosynthesis